MKTIGVFSILGVLCACLGAQAASIIIVVDRDNRTITTTTEHGTATTKVTRTGDTVTAKTTFQPSKPGYQPMGSSGYKPMGNGVYNPMGR